MCLFKKSRRYLFKCLCRVRQHVKPHETCSVLLNSAADIFPLKRNRRPLHWGWIACNVKIRRVLEIPSNDFQAPVARSEQMLRINRLPLSLRSNHTRSCLVRSQPTQTKPQALSVCRFSVVSPCPFRTTQLFGGYNSSKYCQIGAIRPA
jgi:hypothetical protein